MSDGDKIEEGHISQTGLGHLVFHANRPFALGKMSDEVLRWVHSSKEINSEREWRKRGRVRDGEGERWREGEREKWR